MSIRCRAATRALHVAFAVLIWNSPALANGRFPQSQRLLHDPRDPNRLALASTYGIVSSADGARSFQWVCEQAFAKESAEGDPLLEILPDGRWLGGITSSLNRSSDCGCSWETVAASGEHEFVADLSVVANGRVLLLSFSNETGTFVHRLSESTDAGTSWQPLSVLSELALALTLDAAPSRPDRVYVSGYGSDGRGLLGVSNDRGLSFRYLPIAAAGIDDQPYIAAVHPHDPDLVFVRTSSLGIEGAQSDALLVSRDAGETWDPLIRQGGALFGFALSPDGASVAIGFGDRLAPAISADVAALGIYRATVAETFSFEKIYSASVSCLKWTVEGLYACFAERHPELPAPFALGLARDPSFDLNTPEPFEPLLRQADVQGPAACVQPLCAEAWTANTCSRLRARCELSTAPAQFACGAGAGGAPGGSGGIGAGASSGGPALEPVEEPSGGCGCTIPRRGAGAAALELACALVLAMGLRRRNRAQGTGSSNETP